MTEIIRVGRSRSVLEVAPAKPKGSSAGARKAKREGDDFEAELEQSHAAAGVRAAFQRGNIQTKRINGAWVVTGKSGVDFVGSYNGLAVAFDAKSHAGQQSFTLHPKSRTEQAEAEFLSRFAASGGYAFFLIRDPEMERVYLVGSLWLPTLLRGGSVTLRDPITKSDPLPMPRMPYLWMHGREHLERTARGQPIWPWWTLIPDLTPPSR